MPRTAKPIKWDEVIQRMESGNSAQTIANAFEISASYLYERFEREFGVPFAEKRRAYVESGKENIEYIQYKKALAGNDRMLLWLGQVKCGQQVPQSSSQAYTPEDREKLNQINTQLSEMSDALKSSSINNNKDV